ncbi:hypothetical protein COW98_01005 [Candidatus Roizmanbacteria bacterium CG22_combo_CG10-13_8_21_14_all_35_9]|uniref:Uncharacterized protein n=3 Tax=Candidatus Roizmaniibacteriota TaxID=1752723 RepID=A0A2M8F1S4_9BACT|nr:MAG: hypothetical protein COW98_01005 [Candidatus Roizmanbacteria bacterium CG22_combo_CG10-13_8_21_14_all_35_9]PIY71403.1 MAG: hypothetical protein COY88_00535 [Candidatus Roizmanbacteria bacterium CG_4_10_14_0_8_um_filter_35_28]PJC33218.1 MAG: hypothetical protein CO048_03585 [Candidatus Roizmanbacteria bacterium CG_4_9_14_0_2_um_filter_35_15]PJC82673.1 MAG: hypothetical protein CO006_02415 [Candidatus Roizmanbacteria bacterium CG_4_8_14_3_um_filter_35_14]
MELSQFFNLFNSEEAIRWCFKIIAIFLSIFYLLYSVVVKKQVAIMDKALTDRFNQFIFLVCSLQITAALILLIFSIFLV